MARFSGLIRNEFGHNLRYLECIPQNCRTVSARDIKTNSLMCTEKDLLVHSNDKQRDRLFREIQIELRAHQPDVLKSYSWFASTAAKELNIELRENWAEPEPHMMRKTLLKSVFANSKHRVQYEIRTYYHMLKVGKLTESTADTYLEYIQRNLPEGVAMKVTKHERRAGHKSSTNK